MKIAVTTASGQLGKAIVNALIDVYGKDSIVGIARTPEKAKSLGIEIRKGDYNSFDEFNEALKGIDKVLVVSGLDAPEKRIQQHRNIIKAAEENGVKKLVYTSIIGSEVGTAFDAIIKSNRQTEQDISSSKLNWAIGRNGLYIEPDLEYVEKYAEKGCIWNSAADGKCAYTSRAELAKAYVALLSNDDLNGEIYNLSGTPITQQELTDTINRDFNTKLTYKEMSSEEYLADRKNELGEFFGVIVTGIYDGIKKGSFDVVSDFEKVTGRPHQSLDEMIIDFKKS
ncbi:SDR family oxidoreductase [Sediminitomix flava]|uniref:NAD(P)H dehydrogenase (Quinone) n=1 Tax=Sediminitomix flava TaxID=379075 RepID=A0A315Z6Z8_SEDFL|nr:SDR family oxidoreductase [Sediminitomix flava]PWJ39311.1 NAD(P)H dehydrogenase (quinone) [Sediminitomix flava]